MTPGEMAAWAAGYLAGWARSDELAALEGRPDMSDAVRASFRAAQIAGNAKAWRDAVLRGENPTPYEGVTDVDGDGASPTQARGITPEDHGDCRTHERDRSAATPG